MKNLSPSAQPAKLNSSSVKQLSVRSAFSVATLTEIRQSHPHRWARSSSAVEQSSAISGMPQAIGVGHSPVFDHRADRQRFRLQLNLGAGLGNLNAKARRAVVAAARFWERAITGSTNGAKNIVIDITGNRLPGSTLATATPTKFDRNVFPVRGVSTINTRLSRQYNKNAAYLQETMIHEFAHVLGIGTLWYDLIDPATATYRANTAAGQVYGTLLGSPSPLSIPLEPTLGSPGIFDHWSEIALGDEIMTPTDNGKRSRDPVSIVTLAALQDLGWTVNYDAAQFYTLP